MLRLSILFLFISSLLVAQTDIIVRKLILRDAADTKFWTLSQDLAPDTTTILLTDDTGSLRMDWDAQDGVQFFNHILTGTDDTFTLGTTDVRFGTGFATVWNGEIIRIENSAHTAHYSLVHDSTGLDFLDTSDVRMFILKPSGNISILSSTLEPSLNNFVSLGSQDSKEWLTISGRDIIADDAFIVQSSESAAFFTCDSATFKWPLCTITGILGANGGINGDARSATLELGDSGDRDIIALFIEGGDGRLLIKNSTGNTAVDLNSDGDVLGGDTNTGSVLLRNIAGNHRVLLNIDGDNGALWLTNDLGNLAARFSTRGTDGEADSGYWSLETGAGVAKLSAGIDSGGDAYIKFIDASTGATFGAITKDAADTIEVTNLTVSSSGNFYLRSFSANVDCTAGVGGVEDGWIGIQTTDDEIQFCVAGATTRLTPSVLTSDTPSTLTCTSGNVLINAVIKNGIIIGGSCAAN